MRKYSLVDLCRKSIFVIRRNLQRILALFRQLRVFFFTKSWFQSVLGKVYFNSLCNNFAVGKYATLYPYVIFELAENANVSIGHHFTLSYGAVFCCRHSVTIGNYVMIGEYSSIRDSTHGQEVSAIPFCKQADKSDAIVIGNNVWIGRGCIILPGAIIEDNVIIAAHSVVKGRLKANCMYGGAPVKIIRAMA